jgi:hypothetical protein
MVLFRVKLQVDLFVSSKRSSSANPNLYGQLAFVIGILIQVVTGNEEIVRNPLSWHREGNVASTLFDQWD